MEQRWLALVMKVGAAMEHELRKVGTREYFIRMAAMRITYELYAHGQTRYLRLHAVRLV
jgi:hypothetical protein